MYKHLRVEDQPLVWDFIEKNYLERYRLILTVDFEWSASGLWSPKCPGSVGMGAMMDPSEFDLPAEVVAALEEWHGYGDTYMEPWEPKNSFDHEMWSRWGLQVAKRVALALPEDIYLEYNPFRQLVVGNRGTVIELDIPAFIRDICKE